jgi:type IV pilus assembly protein PilM
LIHEFSKTVEDVCKVPSQLINPFNSISYDPSVFTPDYISAIAPIASVPIGLALRAGAK